ncbi:hypothetical protein B9G69_002665 [Bdellovibrio sp. SKB1291214]|uniref:hypothetical protein n=1 Tax=Bdellovibrio sp. SKB1291214 TaxID=1732569 RepID=UPI00159524A3|nr:hypothetical protein [Bdellovibrio sp. SKB1291214]UYL09474.1 hypothetical protein B9G69_002665 [Bdellovibrio sp. SKB1291214]
MYQNENGKNRNLNHSQLIGFSSFFPKLVAEFKERKCGARADEKGLEVDIVLAGSKTLCSVISISQFQ